VGVFAQSGSWHAGRGHATLPLLQLHSTIHFKHSVQSRQRRGVEGPRTPGCRSNCSLFGPAMRGPKLHKCTEHESHGAEGTPTGWPGAASRTPISPSSLDKTRPSCSPTSQLSPLHPTHASPVGGNPQSLQLAAAARCKGWAFPVVLLDPKTYATLITAPQPYTPRPIRCKQMPQRHRVSLPPGSRP
jgi:hypothetical protein